MGGKSNQKEHVTTQQTSLPDWLQPAMQRGVGRAEDVYQQGAPMANFTPWSDQTYQSLDMMENLANQGAGVNPAMANYNATLNGDFLSGGQGFNDALTAASNRIIPQVQSMFSNAGAGNSGLAQVAQAQALGDSFAGLYNNERNRQQSALGMAPQMANLAYQPARMLGQVGAAREGKQQQAADIASFNANQPARSLDEYLQRLQGIAPTAGGTTTNTQPIYQNDTNALLGGLATGAGLLFGGPAGGAAAGSLMGMFTGG